jgi:dipeptidyl aminopeptidase/acylaminoacyl peptidase
MDRDLRETPLYQEAEAFYRTVLEPGFGRVASASGAVASPDGRWVAFHGERLDRLEGHEQGRICLAEADGGGWRQITDGPNDDAEPRWSPDGSMLSFRSDRAAGGVHQIYLLDTDAPAEARLLGTLPGTVEWHAWSPDGSVILAGVAGGAAEQADALGSGTLGGDDPVPSWVPEVESSDDGDAERRSLWTIHVTTGATRRVSAQDRNVWEASWCGPAHAAAVTSYGAGEDAWYGAGVSIFDVETGQERRLLDSDVQLGWAEGSPDGSRIAVIEAICSDRLVVAGDVMLVDIETGTATHLQTPDVDATRVRWRNADQLLAFGRRGMEGVAVEIDVGSGALNETWTSTEGVGGWFHPAGETFGDGLLTVVSSHQRPPVVIAVEDGRERVIADLRHDGHDALMGTIGHREIVRWRSSDDLEIEGQLTVPRSGEAPYPLVLWVHGGPIGATSDHLPGALFGFLLSRGFAILQPDPRGSTGRGRAFAMGVVGDMGGRDMDDDLAGVDAVVASGVADPERLVLTGGSYGGFMAAWIPTQDHRFKAAVAISPVTDWWSERFDSSLGAWVGDFLGGQPEEVPQEYTERSPVLQAANCTTPVLLTAGRHDRATPVGQAVEFYRALREHGVPTEVVKYPEEGHGVSNFPSVLDQATRMVGWFERFLPGGTGNALP